MENGREEGLTDLQYTELKKQINAIWRVLEGDVNASEDWLLNARVNAYYVTKSGIHSMTQEGADLLTKSFETDGGMVYGMVMVMGKGSNAQLNLEVRLDETAILPAYKPSPNGNFSEVMIFNKKVAKGKHTLTLFAQCTSGSAYTLSQGVKMFFFLPGKKFV